MARLGPRQIQFAELHDCFTIAEIIAMEDLGLVERGRGGFFAAAGCTGRNGTLPVNLSGGLKSKGHPVGATGVAQICDVVKELRSGRELGLAQNLGGSGATCVVSILERA
jgi:acetyl-CoA C-acetyltransferase